MKKIFFLLMSVVLFFSAESQAPNNDPTKYVWYKYIYGNKTPRMWADSILDVPHDTTRSKTGWSKTAGNLPYWGNDTTWFAPLRSLTSDLHEGDATLYHSDGSIFNFPGVPGSETSFSGTPTVIDLGNLNYFVNTNGPYKINGTAYPSSSGIVTLPVGTAGVDSGRVDLIVATPSGVGSVQGTNSDDPQEPVADITTTLKITSVLILEDDTTPATPSLDVQVYDENTGFPGEFIFSTSGTITANANNATNLLKGAKDIAITAMNTTGHGIWTYGGTDTLTKTNYTYLIIPIRVDATINAATNYTIQIGLGTTFSNAVPVTTWAIPTFKTASTSYKYVAIPMTEFTGNPKFKIIRINRTGTGGTVNLKLDDIKLQKVGFTSDDGTSLIGGFVRNDTLYGIRKNGANVFMGVVGGTTNTSTNDFSIKPNHITTTEHTAFGMSEIVNGTIAIVQGEGEGHAHVAGRFPVDYYSTNQGKSYARVALPLTGISGAASNDIGNVAGGIVNGSLWTASTEYINAAEDQATRIWLWQSSNGSTWTNPVQVVYDTTTYDLLTVYGHIVQNGSRIMIPTYGSRSGGTTVAVLLISDNGGSTWSAVEMRTGNITDNNVTETDILVTSGNNLIAISRREEHDPALSYSSNNGSTWSDGGILTIATDKGFTDRWHAPYLYKEGSEIFCLFSDRRNWNVPQISVTSSYTSAATWNASDVRIVASSIIQEGWGAYDFGYVSTLGSGENRMLVMYDTSPTSSAPLDLDHNITDIVVSPLPLTPKPLFIGGASNLIFSGGGNAGENDNAIVFERLATRQDNLAMLQGDSSTFIVKETGRYHISGNIHLSATAFATISELNCYVYNPSEDTTGLNNSRIQIGVIGVGGSLGTPFLNLNGTLALFKGQLIKFRVNVDADETLNLTERPIFTIEKIDERSELSGGTNINQTVYDTTAADQALRDTAGQHNIRLIALENAGSGTVTPSPDNINGTATAPVTANLVSHNLLVTTSGYPAGLFFIDPSNGRVGIGDIDGAINGNALVVRDADNEIKAYLGSTGVFRTNSLADTSNYVPESYTTMAWVTDHINNASGGGGGSAAGNYGNLQLNRNGVFTTPASDSLSFTTSGGLNVKNKITSPHLFASVGIDVGTYYGDASIALSIQPPSTWAFNMYDGFGNPRLLLRATGQMGIGAFAPGTGIHVEQRILASNMRGYVMQRASGQTEHMYDWSDESGNVLSAINENGQFTSRIAIVSKAASYTATISDATIVVTATGQTITLPTSVGLDGKTYTIKLTASGSSTVATTSSQTIDGSTTYSLASQYKYVTVQSNGANWIVIANN